MLVLVAAMLLFVALRPLNQAGARRAKELSKAQLEYAGGIGQANRLAEETRCSASPAPSANRSTR